MVATAASLERECQRWVRAAQVARRLVVSELRSLMANMSRVPVVVVVLPI